MRDTAPATSPDHSEVRGISLRKRLMTFAVAALTAALVITGSGIDAQPAQAAAYGPGYDGEFGRIGSYIVGGQVVYCIRPAEPRPLMIPAASTARFAPPTSTAPAPVIKASGP